MSVHCCPSEDEVEAEADDIGIRPSKWLPEPAQAMSVVLMPLRVGELNSTEPAFGMLVLASPDPQRFESGMGTDFLERIAELASAALSRLQ